MERKSIKFPDFKDLKNLKEVGPRFIHIMLSECQPFKILKDNYNNPEDLVGIEIDIFDLILNANTFINTAIYLYENDQWNREDVGGTPESYQTTFNKIMESFELKSTKLIEEKRKKRKKETNKQVGQS